MFVKKIVLWPIGQLFFQLIEKIEFLIYLYNIVILPGQLATTSQVAHFAHFACFSVQNVQDDFRALKPPTDVIFSPFSSSAIISGAFMRESVNMHSLFIFPDLVGSSAVIDISDSPPKMFAHADVSS